jgi:hypothetical protein
MEGLLLLAVGEGDGIVSLIQAQHDPEGLVLHLDLIFRGLILDALDLQLADGGVTDNTGQKELLFRDPDLVGGGDHGDGVCGPGRGAVTGKQAGQQQDQGHHHNGPAAHLSSTLRNSFHGLSFQHIYPICQAANQPRQSARAPQRYSCGHPAQIQNRKHPARSAPAGRQQPFWASRRAPSGT